MDVRIIAPFFVTCVDELEEQVAAAGDDREITDLVNDQETGPAEVDALAGFDSFDAERDSRWLLPVPGGPRK
ncbi:hypothetical protein AS026_02155 [Rhizobium altiplani]|uniref:Uncharacterized protein n=1 Tax=Rhizobium altiplani TaxID=1864509 RepID=A0A120FRG7_9HYPH|nr:hypothetical protein AS026_02155 [Rhizobium altiplani]